VGVASRTPHVILAVIVVAAAVRVLTAATLPLYSDEAYYWVWAQHLDWGYRDHPPMVAYIAYLTTLAGHGELILRTPALLLGLATSYALFLLGRDLFDAQVGLIAAALFQLQPLLWVTGGLLMLPDAPLLLAWTVALRLIWKGLHGQFDTWMAAGLTVGLGLLSKLTMIWLVVGVAVFLITSARLWLRRREPYAAAALALACLIPVFGWNAAHGWAGVKFLALGRQHVTTVEQLAHLPLGLPGIKFFLESYVPLSGALLPVFVWAMWAAWRRRHDERFRYLLWTALPTIAISVVLAPAGAARGHWMAPAHLGLAVVVAALWRRVVGWAMLGNGLVGLALLASHLIPALPPEPLTPFFYGFAELSERVEREVAALGPGTFFVSNGSDVAATVAYYSRGKVPVTFLPYAVGSVWASPNEIRGVAVAVTSAWAASPWKSCFGRVDPVAPFVYQYRGRVIQRFEVLHVSGLLPRCLPAPAAR